MTVERNIAFGLEIKKWDKKRISEKVFNLMELLKIKELGKSMPNEISAGEQQRVSFARAIAVETPIILMDEPF